MERSKKMVLISPDTLERINEGQHPYTKSVSSIEAQLDHVLNETTLPEYDRWVKFVEIFQKYRQKLQEHNNPIKVDIIEIEKDAIQKNQPNSDRIVNEVPARYQNKARLFLDRLRDSDISWNNGGIVLIRGESIQGSNISDLINDVLRNRKDTNPQVWELFANELHRINIPFELIENISRKSYIRHLNPFERSTGSKRQYNTSPSVSH
jgi:hypothetical protein